MTADERLERAYELMRQAKLHLEYGYTTPDPVVERREFAQAANKLRAAADLLDDGGRLDP